MDDVTSGYSYYDLMQAIDEELRCPSEDISNIVVTLCHDLQSGNLTLSMQHYDLMQHMRADADAHELLFFVTTTIGQFRDNVNRLLTRLHNKIYPFASVVRYVVSGNLPMVDIPEYDNITLNWQVYDKYNERYVAFCGGGSGRQDAIDTAEALNHLNSVTYRELSQQEKVISLAEIGRMQAVYDTYKKLHEALVNMNEWESVTIKCDNQI